MSPHEGPRAVRPSTFPWTAADGGLSRLLTDFVGQTASSARRSSSPSLVPAPLTAWETDSAYTVEFEVPGYSPEQIEIELIDDTLTVTGTREASLPEGVELLRNERHRGGFTRTVEFSKEIDDDAVRAAFVHGVLRVTLPKRAEARPRRIRIEATSTDVTADGTTTIPNGDVEISTQTPTPTEEA